MHPTHVKQCADAIDEVAAVLEQLCLKHPKVFDELQVRYPLADELGGFAGMLRGLDRHQLPNATVPVSAKTPRVLVVVSGGVADPVYDNGVDVEVFDWDNHRADPVGTSGVPKHFADLADPLDIPVETDSDISLCLDDGKSVSHGGANIGSPRLTDRLKDVVTDPGRSVRLAPSKDYPSPGM